MQPDNRNLPDLPAIGVNPEAGRNVYDVYSVASNLGTGGFFDFLGTLWTVYSVIALSLSAVFIYGIIYSYLRMNEYSEKFTQKILEDEKRWRQRNDPDQGNRRWQEVEAHVASHNPNDWKLAIIEADVMLEKMLEEAGFAGATIAERLRSASGRSFQTIDDAWQAHRVRNQIAHGGSDFVLTQRMAQTTIVQYKKVFQEFGVI
jgi:hypothetical protein